MFRIHLVLITDILDASLITSSCQHGMTFTIHYYSNGMNFWEKMTYVLHKLIDHKTILISS